MRKYVIIVFLVTGISPSLSARLGETHSQCVARYGPPTIIRMTDRNFRNDMLAGFLEDPTCFKKGDVTILMSFFHAKADKIVFINKLKSPVSQSYADCQSYFSPQEIQILLKANSGAEELTSRKLPTGELVWSNSRGFIRAVYFSGLLHFETEGYRERLSALVEARSAAKKAKEVQNLKDF